MLKTLFHHSENPRKALYSEKVGSFLLMISESYFEYRNE